MSEKIKLPIAGIIRNAPVTEASEGACDEVINIRRKDGAWRPKHLRMPISLQGLDDLTRVYKHSVLDDTTWILADYNNMTISIVSEQGGGKTLITLQTGEVITDGKELGNWFVFTTNKRHIRLLWDGSSYSEQKELQANIEVSVLSQELHDIGNVVNVPDMGDASSYSVNINSTIKGLWNDYLSDKISDINKTAGEFWMRLAIELKDGTYVHHSEPILVNNNVDGNIGAVAFAMTTANRVITNFFFPDCKTMTVNYSIHNHDNIINSEFVKSVVIAVSKPYNEFDNINIESRDIFKDAMDDTGDYIVFSVNHMNDLANNGFRNVTKVNPGAQDLISAIIPESYNEVDKKKQSPETGQYYIVKRLSLDDLDSDNTGSLDVDWSTITSNEVLSINDTRSKDVFIDGKLDIFNKRHVLFNYKRELSTPNSLYYNITEGSGDYNFFAEVKIKENSDVYTVLEQLTNGDALVINKHFVAYPHIGAFEINVYKRDVQTQEVTKIYAIPLIAHPNLNLAYFSKLNATTNVFDTPEAINEAATLPSDNRIVSYNNNLIISNINNPSVFEARHSYNFGDGQAIGVGIPTFTLDEGQFGRFPLFVFTSEGIWALQQGEGEVLYSEQTPTSREVALSRNAIIGTELGVVFLSKSGLMLLQGDKPVSLSESIHLSPSQSLKDDQEYQLYLGKDDIPTDASGIYQLFPQLWDYISTDSFLEYCKNAILAYVYTDEKEIIISNSNYNYSYVLNLDTKVFFKITQVWTEFINSYPDVYGYNHQTYKLHNLALDDTADNIDIFIETAPTKVNSDQYKRITRSILRGLFKREELTLTFSLWVSIDGHKWILFDYMQPIEELFSDIYLNNPSNNIIYFKHCISGRCSFDSYVSYLQLDIISIGNEKSV